MDKSVYILKLNFLSQVPSKVHHNVKKRKQVKRFTFNKNHLLKPVNGASRTGKRCNERNEKLYDWVIKFCRKILNHDYIPTKKEIENFHMSLDLLDDKLDHLNKSYRLYSNMIWNTRRIINKHSSKRKCTYYNVDTGKLAEKQSKSGAKSFNKLTLSSAGQVPVIGPFLGRPTT